MNLPFTNDQVAAVTKTCCDYEAAADGELAREVLRVLAEHMERDEQYQGMYGPLKRYRVAGPWISAETGAIV